jgi:excisionase family DNA binding protein
VTLADGTGNTIMFSVKTAAQELGISVSLMYGLCAAGKIRHERHGLGRGVIRIPDDALDEYRARCTKGAASVPAPRKQKVRLQHLRV